MAMESRTRYIAIPRKVQELNFLMAPIGLAARDKLPYKTAHPLQQLALQAEQHYTVQQRSTYGTVHILLSHGLCCLLAVSIQFYMQSSRTFMPVAVSSVST